VLDPDIVLFDEPDSGLDPVRTALLCELIQEIHEENGGAYVVITHDIMSAKRVAEHISVLWKGRIVESGPADELFNSDNHFVRQFLSGASRGPAGHGVMRQKRPNAARIGAVAVLVVAVAVVAALVLRSSASHDYVLYFQNAGQLVRDDDVQIGGRRIGSVREITLTRDNQARVRVEVEEPYAPLHEGTRAVIRQTSLSGIANRYVALSPGTQLGRRDRGRRRAARGRHDDPRRPRPAVQHLRREDPQGPPERGAGLLRQYDGKGKQANDARGTSTRRSRPRAGWSISSTAIRERSRAFS
jgi:hypothetical protein